MKKLIITLFILGTTAGYAIAEQGFFDFQNVKKTSDIKKGARIAHYRSVSGKLAMMSTSATCTVFVNATTLARTVAGTGMPIAVSNTYYPVNLPQTSHLTFTCTSTAGNSNNVYVVR